MSNLNSSDNYLITINHQIDRDEWECLEHEDTLRLTTQILDYVNNNLTGNLVVLFPAGWFDNGDGPANDYYQLIEKQLTEFLKLKNNNIVACIGIDGSCGADQVAIAISKNGIEAIGRKFYPTDAEKDYINYAKDYLGYEAGKSRIFEMNDLRFYLCVCYDSFGIRKKKLSNPGVEFILNLVHGFNPKGSYEGGSGEVYFAKHGFAGASKTWGCKVFGAATFFDREIPEKWPDGVYWNKGDISTQLWKYKYNPLKPDAMLPINAYVGHCISKVYKI